MPQMLVALDLDWEAPAQVVVAGEKSDPATQALLRAVNGRFAPAKVLLLADEAARAALGARLPWFAAMGPVKDRPAVYVCKDRACEQPLTDPAGLDQLLPQRQLAET
jgi:uncharacterized protein YyaL (SSP411 family)